MKFLSDGQGTVRWAVLYADSFCCLPPQMVSVWKVKNLLPLEQILSFKGRSIFGRLEELSHPGKQTGCHKSWDVPMQLYYSVTFMNFHLPEVPVFVQPVIHWKAETVRAWISKSPFTYHICLCYFAFWLKVSRSIPTRSCLCMNYCWCWWDIRSKFPQWFTKIATSSIQF